MQATGLSKALGSVYIVAEVTQARTWYQTVESVDVDGLQHYVISSARKVPARVEDGSREADQAANRSLARVLPPSYSLPDLLCRH